MIPDTTKAKLTPKSRVSIYKHKEKKGWYQFLNVVVESVEPLKEKLEQLETEMDSDQLKEFIAQKRATGKYWVNATENGGYIITKREPIVTTDKTPDEVLEALA